MKTTKHTHTYVQGKHVTTVVIEELPDRIDIKQYVNFPDPTIDQEAFKAWFIPIALPYENDRRPQVYHNMQTGDECSIVDLR